MKRMAREGANAYDAGGKRTESLKQTRWWLRIAGIASLMVICLGAWGCTSDDDEEPSGGEQPTLTFDGTTATYDGPATLEAGEVTFTLVNDSDREAAFVWQRYREEGVTLEEARAWYEENPATSPPWALGLADIGDDVPAGTTVEQSGDFIAGPGELFAFDDKDDKTYLAAIIEVTDE